jgi:SAM-dependent methyltransferase
VPIFPKSQRLVRRCLDRVIGWSFDLVFARPGKFEKIVRWGLKQLLRRQPPPAELRRLSLLLDLIERLIDKIAIEYEGGELHPKHRLTAYHDFFVNRIQPSERVLDIGCGRGAVVNSIATRAGASVTGVDLNADHIEFARQKWSHTTLEFLAADATDGLPDGQYDTVVLSNVLEHIEERVAFLRDLCEHAKPMRLLIRVPLFERSWHVPMMKELGLDYFADDTHFIEYTQSGFVEEMHQAGLRVNHMEIRWGEIWAEAVPISK